MLSQCKEGKKSNYYLYLLTNYRIGCVITRALQLPLKKILL